MLDIALGLIFVSYACARVLEIAPTSLPRMAIVALDVLSALAFGLLDGARHYGYAASWSSPLFALWWAI